MISITFFIKLALIFILTSFFIKVIIHFAQPLGLVDRPNHRSIHKDITPRGAGIAIVFGILFSDIIYLNPIVIDHLMSFIAIFIVFIVGVLDDHRDIVPKVKFSFIFLAVLLLAYDGIIIDSLGNFFNKNLILGWLSIPFTIFAVVGFTNALNLSDGLDGLAGSLSIVILSTLCIIGFEHQDFFIFSISLSFIVAILAFMWFNWNPAKIFMGDSGSLTLGFVISILSIKSLQYIQPSTILFITAIPIFDTLIVMIRRKSQGRSIVAPDKFHLHHVLMNFFNGDIKKTVVFIILLQMLYSLTGYMLTEMNSQSYILIFFILNLVILYILLTAMITKQTPFALRKKRKKKQ